MGAAIYEDKPVPAPVNRSWGMLLKGNGTSAFVSPMDEHTGLWSVHARTTTNNSPWLASTDSDIQSLLSEAHRRTEGYTPLLGELIGRTDPSLIRTFDARDKMPIKHDLNMPVVSVGDANHAVSPFAGNGANLALTDGWDLATQLCQSESFAEAVEKFDAYAIPRSRTVIRQSHFTIAVAFSTGLKYQLYLLFLRVVDFVVGNHS
jgi:2-polyprenyl-6-methoxyphenol hydroxylase-like FAD-dependent oxidoreductase